ncbi:MAG: NAD(P)/FAD-dependent oxidoreductase [Nanoarchaeota archaeon]|nr:NAD(P)/FAD-dependent oxidoreductase [Nanoarchaeota archaeon]
MNYDVILIGGGTAGLAGALRLAEAGKEVLLAEPKALGGTCLNTGCIPSKAMLHASEVFVQCGKAGELGILARPRVDFKKLMARVRGFVSEGQEGIRQSMPHRNLTVLRHKARLVGKRSVEIAGKTYSAKRIIIATGSVNLNPAIPGLDAAKHYTNENILTLKKLPKRVLCVGGGYISMEYATFFSQLGSKVTILEAGAHVLGMLDDDARKELLGANTALNIVTKTNIRRIRESRGTIIVDLPTRSFTGDALIVAAGRVPHTAGLNLASAGVDTDERGAIKVDEQFRTANRRVYAVGDCTGRAMFAHTAKREIDFVIHRLLNTESRIPDLGLVPWVVFTSPPVAGVGLSEREAKKKGFHTGTLKAPFSYVGRAAILGQERGFAKLVYDLKTGKILGSTIVGPRADDLIHELTALMNMNATVRDLRMVIHAHPTLSEIFSEL